MRNSFARHPFGKTNRPSEKQIFRRPLSSIRKRFGRFNVPYKPPGSARAVQTKRRFGQAVRRQAV
ncbi:hypothetical protein NEIELOOT_01119 [Neisseria elongata subsp. glycolytica ATCC 29315]|uniref:Uncharacterized protein n=1 Tax=Neisseria elongata subsp. glycolytica ATCC 29315 TaxID=546263 RepID=D4DPY2_NEIEG|nr:hypothetical protein NEIELOOT_01119 [Neisseria elongata subsp. glycolytica ATCC 29315]